jgi:hypothetical protein
MSHENANIVHISNPGERNNRVYSPSIHGAFERLQQIVGERSARRRDVFCWSPSAAHGPVSGGCSPTRRAPPAVKPFMTLLRHCPKSRRQAKKQLAIEGDSHK